MGGGIPAINVTACRITDHYTVPPQQETNANFRSFMAQLTQNEHVDVLGLQSYLIKPLQRITKVLSGRHHGDMYSQCHVARPYAILI
jgi:hypothetical protein